MHDGNIGFIEDFLFDDRRWTIRYLVADTGCRLERREVLVTPAAAHPPLWHERVPPVAAEDRQQLRAHDGRPPCSAEP